MYGLSAANACPGCASSPTGVSAMSSEARRTATRRARGPSWMVDAVAVAPPLSPRPAPSQWLVLPWRAVAQRVELAAPTEIRDAEVVDVEGAEPRSHRP